MGTYNESVSINSFASSSPNSKVTIESASGDSSLVIMNTSGTKIESINAKT
ncbi:MAG: hypothetical protein WCO63_06680 [Bacteroidota bacterium]